MEKRNVVQATVVLETDNDKVWKVVEIKKAIVGTFYTTSEIPRIETLIPENRNDNEWICYIDTILGLSEGCELVKKESST